MICCLNIRRDSKLICIRSQGTALYKEHIKSIYMCVYIYMYICTCCKDGLLNAYDFQNIS